VAAASRFRLIPIASIVAYKAWPLAAGTSWRTRVSRRRRRIKIIATLGPASADRATLAKLFEAGADVFRINMSHASHDGMRERIAMIRSLEEEVGRPIGILVDLQGPKLRVGEFLNGAETLRRGDPFALDSNATPGDQTRVYLPHPEILASVQPGHRVLIDDGKVLLRVFEVSAGRADCIVEVAGKISNKKGVSLPDTTLPTSAMTPKDRADLDAALEENIDWIALSFVQRPEDVIEVKRIVGARASVMAKIEKPQAIACLEDILAVSDALMVARGDLGVEMPLERVPGLQKSITRMARRVGKPVVVATQMLESMITTPVPTRAEVSDVATAVFEGADAIMLSAESASGQFPREAVATMNRIAETVESEPIYPSIIDAQRATPEATGADAIAGATRDVADILGAKVICAWTTSGSTGLRIARERPRSSILALTPIPEVARRLAVVWGVHAVVTEDARDERDMTDRACRHAYIDGFAGVGERLIVVAGVPFGTPGRTNNLRIAVVGQDGGAA
jgi:pyruvate kinase